MKVNGACWRVSAFERQNKQMPFGCIGYGMIAGMPVLYVPLTLIRTALPVFSKIFFINQYCKNRLVGFNGKFPAIVKLAEKIMIRLHWFVLLYIRSVLFIGYAANGVV